VTVVEHSIENLFRRINADGGLLDRFVGLLRKDMKALRAQDDEERAALEARRQTIALQATRAP